MKLTNADRDAIIAAAAKDVFQERKASVDTEENDVACLIYEAMYPPHVRHKMAALPDDFFHQKSAVYALVGDCSDAFVMQSSRKISASDNVYREPYLRTADQPLLDRIAAHHASREKLKNDRERFKQELKMFLAGINTDKQLKETWPEGEPYYSALFTQSTRNLPAVQSDSINNLIRQMKA